MKITRVKIGVHSVPLKKPFKTALRSVDRAEEVVVALCTDTGAIGYGGAPPVAAVTGETVASITGAIEYHLGNAVLGRDVADMDENIDALCASIVHNTSAKAAVEVALWDLFGQLYHAPLYRLFGGSRRTLRTDITISVNDPDEMARDASEAAALGYTVIKIKVGGQSALDVERLVAVREAVGEEIVLRADANQAWEAARAIRLLEQIQAAGVNLSLVEQPVAAHDIEGLKAVTDARIVPVMADESVFSPRDALQVLHKHAADFLNIKLMKTGGLREAFRIADLAQLFGVECGIGCMLETALCVNAAAHLACAHKNITMIDLDGPMLCAENPVQGGAVFQGSHITMSDRPGLGIQKLTHVHYLSGLSSKT